jgi:hypothetical protein
MSKFDSAKTRAAALVKLLRYTTAAGVGVATKLRCP